MAEAAMQGANCSCQLLTRSNLGFSILLKDTSTCSHGLWVFKKHDPCISIVQCFNEEAKNASLTGSRGLRSPHILSLLSFVFFVFFYCLSIWCIHCCQDVEKILTDVTKKNISTTACHPCLQSLYSGSDHFRAKLLCNVKWNYLFTAVQCTSCCHGVSQCAWSWWKHPGKSYY